MVIHYYIRSSYGNPRMYIADQLQADAVARLTGKKTVSLEDIDALHALGFMVEVVPDPEMQVQPITA